MRVSKYVFLLLLTIPIQANATDYFLATFTGGGSDSNSGLSAGTPWLTPNHALNCGDTITAAASTTYSASNFYVGNWGTVTCPTNDNVAMLKCETFDGCKITVSSGIDGMKINKSYWGVSGWEVINTGTGGGCFTAAPTSGASIHHIVFANNIANRCASSGFTTYPYNTSGSVDYVVIIGNIAWNAATATTFCNSGISVYEPIKTDSEPGTHIYIAGNFTFDTFSPTNCNGGGSTYDGNGIVLDDVGGAQSGLTPYDQQIVVDNNLSVFNGVFGLATTGNGSTDAPIYFRNNTSYGNLAATNTDTMTCGEMTFLDDGIGISMLEAYNNLVMTNVSMACQGQTKSAYAMAINGGNGTDSIHNNFLYSAAGHATLTVSSPGFSFGSNTIGTDPSFSNPVDPGQPNCSGTNSVVDCMSTVIANFTPRTAAARPFGYQIPSANPVDDSLFPRWLCNVNLPSGLVTIGCLAAPAPAPPTDLQIVVH